MEEILQTFLSPGAWLALLTLAFMEVVLGIDNIVFLSLMTGKLPASQQRQGRFVGLFLAMLARIGLLFGVSVLMSLTRPLWSFAASWVSAAVTGQSLIILIGGFFLLWKSVTEIHDKIEGAANPVPKATSRKGFWNIIAQVVALDIIFSLDSVMTAVGMVSFTEFGHTGAMTVMVTAVVAAVMLMMLFSGPISRFVNEHPSVQMLALSFLILIGVMLLVESAHLSRLELFGRVVGEIPKGYIYFAIAFSLGVEVLNLRFSRKNEK
jgi:predicted tellurium resistance membrane protein TerC